MECAQCGKPWLATAAQTLPVKPGLHIRDFPSKVTMNKLAKMTNYKPKPKAKQSMKAKPKTMATANKTKTKAMKKKAMD